VLGPAAIEFSPLFVGQLQLGLALDVGKAIPERHRDLGTVARRKLEELS
jgi:hypothetical protein